MRAHTYRTSAKLVCIHAHHLILNMLNWYKSTNTDKSWTCFTGTKVRILTLARYALRTRPSPHTEYMCPHTAIHVSWDNCFYLVLGNTSALKAFKKMYMCLHTAIYVSWYYFFLLHDSVLKAFKKTIDQGLDKLIIYDAQNVRQNMSAYVI
jgi:hypothetical protein